MFAHGELRAYPARRFGEFRAEQFEPCKAQSIRRPGDAQARRVPVPPNRRSALPRNAHPARFPRRRLRSPRAVVMPSSICRRRRSVMVCGVNGSSVMLLTSASHSSLGQARQDRFSLTGAMQRLALAERRRGALGVRTVATFQR